MGTADSAAMRSARTCTTASWFCSLPWEIEHSPGFNFLGFTQGFHRFNVRRASRWQPRCYEAGRHDDEHYSGQGGEIGGSHAVEESCDQPGGEEADENTREQAGGDHGEGAGQEHPLDGGPLRTQGDDRRNVWNRRKLR